MRTENSVEFKWDGIRQRARAGVKCETLRPTLFTRTDKCNNWMNWIHYPMTWTNYPFNAIWGIVSSSCATSRTFPASLTQKHRSMKSLVSKHSVNTERSRRFVFRTGHCKREAQGFRSVKQAVRARACVAAASARLLATQWALGGGAKLAVHSSRAYENYQLRLSPH